MLSLNAARTLIVEVCSGEVSSLAYCLGPDEEGHYPLRDANGTIQCSKRFFFFGALLIFIGSILLCGLGFTVILPYKETSVWPATTCRVTSALYSPYLCSCEQRSGWLTNIQAESDQKLDEDGTGFEETSDCMRTYPCLQVFVTYQAHPDNPDKHSPLSSLFRTWNDAFYNTVIILKVSVLHKAPLECFKKFAELNSLI